MPRPERAVDPSAGVVQELAAGLRELRSAAGNPGYRELAAVAGYSVTTLSDAAGGRRLPGLPVVLAYVKACGGDPEEWEKRWRAAAEALATQRAAADIAPEADPPYLGLVSFGPLDEGRFFGRERLVAELMQRLADDRFLAVFGASGSGKSSLLRAGLLPAARRAGWDPILCTPDARTRPVPLPTTAEGLLIVDQFEETFTHRRHGDEWRQRFIETLLDPERPGRIVIGVRADFYASCARIRALATAMRDATLLVGPMSDDDLTRAITRPAAAAGLTVERALVIQVLADAAGQPGALPLVSHALLETWRQRKGTTLTVAGYHAAGGVSGAIAATAERVYGGFDEHQQSLARHILVRLIALGEGTEDTRRRVHRSELDFDSAAAVIDELVAARLVVADADTVEIAHEALIQAWPRLRGWLTDDREALRLHRQLTEAAVVWESLGEDSGALYRGARLALTRDWAGAGGNLAVLTPAERRFLNASEGIEAAERAAAERRTALLRTLTAGLAFLLVLALTAAGVAARQWRNAVDHGRQALSRQLAAEAVAAVSTDVAQAMQLAIDGYQVSSTVEARGALLSLAGRRTYSGKLSHAAMVNDVAFSGDGLLLATAAQNGFITLWTVAGRAERARLSGYSDGATAVAFSPDSRLLATGGRDGNVILWDVDREVAIAKSRLHRDRVGDVAFSPDGSLVASIGTDRRIMLWRVADREVVSELAGHGGERTTLSFSPDGRRLVSAGNDGTAVVWDLASQTRVATLSGGGSGLHAVTFSPDGRLVAGGGQDRDIVVWDAATAEPVAVLSGHTGRVLSLVFSADGRRLHSAGFDPLVIVWDVTDLADTQRQRRVADLAGHSTELFAVAVSPDGSTVASAGRDRTALLWDRADIPMAAQGNEISALAVSPDGGTIVSASNDGTAVSWDVALRRPAPVVLRHSDQIVAVTFSPDGRHIATASADRRVRIWDAASWINRRRITCVNQIGCRVADRWD